mmetsp:Transcript_10324/g.19566  ORF Transcript_10324/g.19566 Transcript_10324/m.19566 type:complete len:729 (-) Transcript_10324:121-2307(-)|eukprot:CAMPEP_0114251730 /NCGR_PEP_ID=MMETSP0058-20121206/15432_1 /TAXON_ID=36894 /ORGANISM="Pyramimonas parkeae, CCMP726" /LENGTH=728 /DNA_ID=CAMNT_0001365563 /DNA_START=152 /DNA_END=2338 /DNA_ORIENTATION=+
MASLPAINFGIQQLRALLIAKSEYRDEETVQKIVRMLQPVCEFFRTCPKDIQKKLAKGATVEVFQRNDFVFREGDPGDKLYIVLTGQLIILRGYEHRTPGHGKGRHTSDAKPKVLRYIGPGSSFGEIATLNRLVRSNSVKANARAELVTFHIAQHSSLGKQLRKVWEPVLLDRMKVLSQVQVLRDHVPAPQLRVFAAYCYEYYHPPGTVFFPDASNAVYFLVEGQARYCVPPSTVISVTKQEEPGDANPWHTEIQEAEQASTKRVTIIPSGSQRARSGVGGGATGLGSGRSRRHVSVAPDPTDALAPWHADKIKGLKLPDGADAPLQSYKKQFHADLGLEEEGVSQKIEEEAVLKAERSGGPSVLEQQLVVQASEGQPSHRSPVKPLPNHKVRVPKDEGGDVSPLKGSGAHSKKAVRRRNGVGRTHAEVFRLFPGMHFGMSCMFPELQFEGSCVQAITQIKVLTMSSTDFQAQINEKVQKVFHDEMVFQLDMGAMRMSFRESNLEHHKDEFKFRPTTIVLDKSAAVPPCVMQPMPVSSAINDEEEPFSNQLPNGMDSTNWASYRIEEMEEMGGMDGANGRTSPSVVSPTPDMMRHTMAAARRSESPSPTFFRTTQSLPHIPGAQSTTAGGQPGEDPMMAHLRIKRRQRLLDVYKDARRRRTEEKSRMAKARRSSLLPHDSLQSQGVRESGGLPTMGRCSSPVTCFFKTDPRHLSADQLVAASLELRFI